MRAKDLVRILRPAARTSKKGWRIVSGAISPETFEALERLAAQRPAFRSELVREAIELLLEREATRLKAA